jgi:hypothetical protein
MRAEGRVTSRLQARPPSPSSASRTTGLASRDTISGCPLWFSAVGPVATRRGVAPRVPRRVASRTRKNPATLAGARGCDRTGLEFDVTTIDERFWSKVDQAGGPEACWPWLAGKVPDGYGSFRADSQGGCRGAHRVSYELTCGPIPDGLVIDHLCHTNSTDCPSDASCPHRGCVNPAHLEAVTVAENNRRSYANASALHRSRTHCDAGHPFNEENTFLRSDGGRRCRICYRAAIRDANRLYRKRNRDEVNRRDRERYRLKQSARG